MLVFHRGAELICFHRPLAVATRRRLVSIAAAKSNSNSSSNSPSSTSRSTSTPTTTTRKTLSAGPHTHVHEVNKSRFVATAFGGVTSAQGALDLIRSHSAKDASHNCFAFVVRRGRSERCSDDGEPAGTAGRPILAAISGEGLEEVAVVVSRWRHGPKLGPGGLSRAYGAAARECVRSADVVEVGDRAEVAVVVAARDVGAAYAALSSRDARDIREEYGSGGGGGAGDSGDAAAAPLAAGRVRLQASVPVSTVEGLAAAIANTSNGRGSVTVLEEERGE